MEITQELKDKIDEMITSEMAFQKTVGTSLGIIHKDQLIYTKSYGAKDLENRIPPNKDTLFCVASVTKSFVSMAIMKLQEESKLSIQDPVNKYLPVKLGYEDDPILIKHLMTHSSGIPDLSDWALNSNYEEMYGLQTELPKIPFISWSDVYTHINGAQEYVERPNVEFHYNNMCYGLLGEIIEKVAGVPFQEFIKSQILNPIGMTQSGFKHNNVLADENLAKCYIKDASSKKNRVMAIEYPIEEIMDAAGGLFCSITELARYAALHLNKGFLDGTQLISEEIINEMQKQQFVESYPNTSFTAFYGDYGKTGYGYGFVINEDFFGTKLIQHSGSYSGASAWFAILPEKEIGVVMLSNKHPSPRMFAQAILIELLGLSAKDNFHVLRLRNHFEKFTGTYQSYKNIDQIKVTNNNGQLYVKFNTDGSNVPIIPKTDEKEPFDFYIPTETGGKMPFRFEVTDEKTWAYFERNKWKKIS